MKLTETRIDPSLLSNHERELIDQLSQLVQDDERPALIGREGVRIDLPDPVFHLLVRIVRLMKQGKAIMLFPETECLTTQASANFLGMSRPFLVALLERGEIQHHRVGAHRRVYLKDLVAYQKKRDSSRKESMGKLFDSIEAAGVYDNV